MTRFDGTFERNLPLLRGCGKFLSKPMESGRFLRRFRRKIAEKRELPCFFPVGGQAAPGGRLTLEAMRIPA